MWSPTHIQVLVKRAKGLKTKGKDGTNDAFVIIGLGKEKFRTSTKEKAQDPIEWMEQCELAIPSHGNTAEVALTVLHRNLLGVDEFLGQVTLPLKDFDVYERPKARWYSLKCKPGQTKKDYRGELEVRIGFTVKASDAPGGSTADLTKKNKGSLSSLNKVAGTIGGSLMSLGNKEKKNIKKLAKSVTHKVEKVGEKAKKSVSSLKLNKDKGGALESLPETRQWSTLDRRGVLPDKNLDPGVNSDDEGDDEFKFEALSHKSSASSLGTNKMGRVSNTSTPFSGSLEAFNVNTPPAFRQNRQRNNLDDWDNKLFGKKGEQQQMETGSIGGDSQVTSNFDSPAFNRAANLSISSNQSNNWSPAVPPKDGNRREDMRGDKWSPQPIRDQADPTNPFERQPSIRKKIIPVQQDYMEESSPSPESMPSSPAMDNSTNSINNSANSTLERQEQEHVSKEQKSNTWNARGNNSARLGVSASTLDLTAVQRKDQDNKKRTLGLKLKNSYSSLFDLSKVGKSKSKFFGGGSGFKDKDDIMAPANVQSKRNSMEASESVSRHSRTHSDGSFGPPNGTRVVLGRETSPIPNTGKVPQDVIAKYNGKSKEELVEMLYRMESTVETQAKRVSDLEEYIDSLLLRVMEVAPVLLQKDLNNQKAGIRNGSAAAALVEEFKRFRLG